MNYKIIGGDGKEYGPVTLEGLRAWVAEGRANGATLVQREDGPDWRPLATYAEVGLVAPGPLASPASDPRPAIDLQTWSDTIRQRDYSISVGACLGRSVRLLSENLGLLLGAVAILLGIQIGLSLVSLLPLVGILVSVLAFLISGPLVGGFMQLFLKRIRGVETSIGDLFDGFRVGFVQLMLVYAVPTIIVAVCALPGIAMMAASLLAVGFQGSLSGLWLLVVGGVLVIIPVFVFTVCWIFALPLVMDRGLDFWRAMELSRKTAQKHLGQIFLLFLASFLIYLLGFLLLGVGLLVSVPIAVGMILYAYEDIFGARPESPEAPSSLGQPTGV